MTTERNPINATDLLNECVILRNMEGRMTGWNRVAGEIHGVSRDRAISIVMGDFFEARFVQGDYP